MYKKILVVDDDVLAVDIIRTYLHRERYIVFTAHNGRDALNIAHDRQPDLIILDLMLPLVSGWDVCRTLRDENFDIPIIMLTARTTEDDILLGLDLGADDYIKKPFSPRELVARIRTVLKRGGHTIEQPEEDDEEIHIGDLHMNRVNREVRIQERVVYNLTPSEFRLLEVMVREPRRVFTRAQLLERCLGLDNESMERTIDFHVMNLRRKIEPDNSNPRYIETVFGVGYRFAQQVETTS